MSQRVKSWYAKHCLNEMQKESILVHPSRRSVYARIATGCPVSCEHWHDSREAKGGGSLGTLISVSPFQIFRNDIIQGHVHILRGNKSQLSYGHLGMSDTFVPVRTSNVANPRLSVPVASYYVSYLISMTYLDRNSHSQSKQQMCVV
jgi:hypothetical protein